MNYIVTITDKNFILYTYRLIYSLREIGYKGEIVVLTPDDDIYCNCKVIKVKKTFESVVPNLNDSRWLQFDLLKPDIFKDGDKIIYLDSDVVVFPDFDFKKMFKEYTFATSIIYHDRVKEYPKLRKILEKNKIDYKYIATPFVFEVNHRARRFFRLCKIAQEVSNLYKRGSLFAFNLACHVSGIKIQIIPKDKCIYTFEMEKGLEFKNPILIHYGGKVGKQIWNEEYLDNQPSRYIKQSKKKKHEVKRVDTGKDINRIAFQTTEGLGNQIETYLVYRVLIEKYQRVDVLFFFHDKDNVCNIGFYEIIAKYFGTYCYVSKNGVLPGSVLKRYQGLVTCRKQKIQGIPLLAQNSNYAHGSEVDRNVEVLTDLGYTQEEIPDLFEEYLPINWKEVRGEDFNDDLPEYDVVICCGSRHSLKWIKKRYLRLYEVVEELKGEYSIACVGHADELITGCDDYTHLNMEETFDFCSKAKVCIVMCSGLLHFLNLIGKENIVIYGPTDQKKNTHVKEWGGFHKFSTILTGGECKSQPCQRNWRLQKDWFDCVDYKCMQFDPKSIIKAVRERLLEIEFEGMENE